MKFIVIALALIAVVSATPISLEKRRFGQEHTPRADADFQAMINLAAGTGFEAQLGDLSGAAVRALLAKAGACDQQDVADQCVDLAQQIGQKFANSFGPQREKDLIKVCKDYRTLERNTPQAGQPSALCDRKPRNKELNGLVQAQDPTGNQPTTKPGQPKTTPTTTSPPKAKPTGKGKGKGKSCSHGKKKCSCHNKKKGKSGKKGKGTGGKPSGKVNNKAFTNPVGGVQMPLITKLPAGSGANFEVNGSKFQNIGAAHNRQCDIQHNLCFDKFNGGDHSFQGSDCDNQDNVCKAGDPVFSN